MLHTSCNGSLQYSKQEFCAIHLYLTAPFFDACVYVMIYLSIGMNEALWCKGIRNTNTWNLTRWNVEDTVNPSQLFFDKNHICEYPIISSWYPYVCLPIDEQKEVHSWSIPKHNIIFCFPHKHPSYITKKFFLQNKPK